MPTQILLLQGPIGPFFERFGRELEQAGHSVHKINFNGGDEFFYSRANTIGFRGRESDWRDFFSEQLRALRIKHVYLYDHTREHHAVAIRIAQALGVKVFVFNDGYLRPDCITMEEVGANGRASLPRSPSLYPYTRDEPDLKPVPAATLRNAFYSGMYNLASRLFGFSYPHYKHQRPLRLLQQSSHFMLSAWRKVWYSMLDAERLQALVEKQNVAFFVCALPRLDDPEMTSRSRFKSVEELIQSVIHNFAAHAPDISTLVFKHPGADRGRHNYQRVIRVLSKLHNVQQRVLYVHDCSMPDLLRAAAGTLTVNAATGLASAALGTPVKSLGDAIYDLPGLAYQEALDHFWRVQGSVDPDLFRRFRNYLLSHSQINGSFYRRLPGVDTPTGLHWPEDIAALHGLQGSRKGNRGERTIAKPLPPVSNALDLGKHYNHIDATEADAVSEPAGEPTYPRADARVKASPPEEKATIQ